MPEFVINIQKYTRNFYKSNIKKTKKIIEKLSKI